MANPKTGGELFEAVVAEEGRYLVLERVATYVENELAVDSNEPTPTLRSEMLNGAPISTRVMFAVAKELHAQADEARRERDRLCALPVGSPDTHVAPDAGAVVADLRQEDLKGASSPEETKGSGLVLRLCLVN